MKLIPFIISLILLGAQGVSYAQENQRFFDDIYYTPSDSPESYHEEEHSGETHDRNQDYRGQEDPYAYDGEEDGYYTRQIHRFYRPHYSFGYFSGVHGFYDPWWGPYWAGPGISIHLGWGTPYWGGYPAWGYYPYGGMFYPWGAYPYYGYGGGYWPGYYHGFHDGYHAGGGYGRQVNYGPRVNQINPRAGRPAPQSHQNAPRENRDLRQAVPLRTNPQATEGGRPVPLHRDPGSSGRFPDQRRANPQGIRPSSPQRIQNSPPMRTQPVTPPAGSRRAPSSGTFNPGNQRMQATPAPSAPRYSAPASRPSSGGSAPRSSGGQRYGGRR